MERVTLTLSDFVAKTAFDDLPYQVIEQTKRVLLDSIGCALGSYISDRAKLFKL